MHCKSLKQNTRRIAGSLLGLALLPGLAIGAEAPGIRLSPPTLGWILAPDGSQIVEITGVTDSPRAGRALSLPAAARRAWTSPDAAAVLLQLDTGLFLVRSNEQGELLTDLPAGAEVSAAWDRASTGFAACWETNCEARSANGAVRSRWEVAASTRAIAYSDESGLLTGTPESAEWRRGADVIRLDAMPVAAAFRAGTQEIWLLDAGGHLSGQDARGRRVGEGELVAAAVGLAGSLDGKSFFAANADGAAAVFSMESGQSEHFVIEDTVEGVWAAPGLFAARLHESAKRPVAIWNGESGTTGWMPSQPAAEIEVRP